MPIPDFQTVMLPLLVHLSDRRKHSNQETLKDLAGHFQFSDEELAQLLPSGLQAIYTNRIANLVLDQGVGATRATPYEDKGLDSDYFEES